MIAKKIIVLIFISLFTIPAFSQSSDAIMGKWLNSSGEGQTMIYKKGSFYYGKLVWLKNPNDEEGKPKMDSKNPVASLKTKPLLGLEILKKFKYTDEGVWENGSIYDPKTGKTYSCKLSMVSSDKLDVRGYVGFSLLGRTETWTRVR
ncbi:DUF2147 domain-containing protein [Daejeonella oryzae]|uniref:DUF2147 domain-containing protein n=1 Tax=Daejeonella oryzae TaxID=1122943 RepID=UPI0003FB61F8|nr:DUF2147 domain-containing protein [Daejeonella oryzae]